MIELYNLDNLTWGYDPVAKKYWRKRYNQFQNDLTFVDGIACTFPLNVMVEPCPQPTLKEGEEFQYTGIYKNKPYRGGHPNDVLTFERQDGFRFVSRCEDWRMEIPFQFQSTDTRVGWYDAKWVGRSGKLIREIVNSHKLKCVMGGPDGGTKNDPSLIIFKTAHHWILVPWLTPAA